MVGHKAATAVISGLDITRRVKAAKPAQLRVVREGDEPVVIDVPPAAQRKWDRVLAKVPRDAQRLELVDASGGLLEVVTLREPDPDPPEVRLAREIAQTYRQGGLDAVAQLQAQTQLLVDGLARVMDVTVRLAEAHQRQAEAALARAASAEEELAELREQGTLAETVVDTVGAVALEAVKQGKLPFGGS